MRLEEIIMSLTARTPSGGGFWLGSHYFRVRYSANSWEWEYQDNVFSDLQDLAEEVQRRSGAVSPLVRRPPESAPDQRRVARG